MRKIMIYAGCMTALIIGLMISGKPDKKEDEVPIAKQVNERQIEAAFTETSVKYNSVSEASQHLNFNIQVPALSDMGYVQSGVSIINESILQISYIGADNTITYRIGEGMGNISGNYELYSLERPLTIYGVETTVRGNSLNSIQLVYFTKDELRYSLSFQYGVMEEKLVEIIESIW